MTLCIARCTAKQTGASQSSAVQRDHDTAGQEAEQDAIHE
jgi:hypothetical protein